MVDYVKLFERDMELIKRHHERLIKAIGPGIVSVPQQELVKDIGFLLEYTMGKAIASVKEHVKTSTPAVEHLKSC